MTSGIALWTIRPSRETVRALEDHQNYIIGVALRFIFELGSRIPLDRTTYHES